MSRQRRPRSSSPTLRPDPRLNLATGAQDLGRRGCDDEQSRHRPGRLGLLSRASGAELGGSPSPTICTAASPPPSATADRPPTGRLGRWHRPAPHARLWAGPAEPDDRHHRPPDGPAGPGLHVHALRQRGDGALHLGARLGTLPSGITLSSSGTIAGTTSATGTFSVTVRVTDSEEGHADRGDRPRVITTGTASWNAAPAVRTTTPPSRPRRLSGWARPPARVPLHPRPTGVLTSVGANKDQPLVVGKPRLPDRTGWAPPERGTRRARPPTGRHCGPRAPTRPIRLALSVATPVSLYSNGTAARVRGTRRLAHGSGLAAQRSPEPPPTRVN